MDAFPHDKASVFVGWSGVQNWLFCLKFESNFGREGPVFTTRGSRFQLETLPTILIDVKEAM